MKINTSSIECLTSGMDAKANGDSATDKLPSVNPKVGGTRIDLLPLSAHIAALESGLRPNNGSIVRGSRR